MFNWKKNKEEYWRNGTILEEWYNQCARDVFLGRNVWMKVRLTYFNVWLVEQRYG